MTAKNGKLFIKFPVTVDPAVEGGTTTWWNCSIMEGLLTKLPDGFLRKFNYAKFVGLGTRREYHKADGSTGISNDILVTGIEMQATGPDKGTFLQGDRPEPETEPF